MKRLFLTFFVLSAPAAVVGEPAGPGTEADIRTRLMPVGTVCVEGQDCGGRAGGSAAAMASSGASAGGGAAPSGAGDSGSSDSGAEGGSAQAQGDGAQSAEGADGATQVAASGGGDARSGETVYNSYCFACHMAGVAGAPKLGDAEAWAPRIDKGKEALYQSTYNGLNAMPPRGTCMNCSDQELQNAVDWMVAQVEGGS